MFSKHWIKLSKYTQTDISFQDTFLLLSTNRHPPQTVHSEKLFLIFYSQESYNFSTFLYTQKTSIHPIIEWKSCVINYWDQFCIFENEMKRWWWLWFVIKQKSEVTLKIQIPVFASFNSSTWKKAFDQTKWDVLALIPCTKYDYKNIEL